MTGKKGMDSAVFGAVGMYITGHLMELLLYDPLPSPT